MARRFGGLVIDLVYISVLLTWFTAFFGVTYLTSWVSSPSGGSSTSIQQLPYGTGWLLYPAYFGFFWLLFRSTPGQMALRKTGIRTHWLARLAVVGVVAVGIVAGSLAFDYFGRPALVIQNDVNTHSGVLADVSSYSLGSPTRSADTISYPITFVNSKGWHCTGRVGLEWGGFLAGWNRSNSESVCHAPPGS